MPFGTREMYSYIAIVVCLFTIYFGIKQIREKHLGGIISFKTALYHGCIMASVAGILIGMFDVIYVTLINPEYSKEYLNYLTEKAKNSGKTEEEITKIIVNDTKRVESTTPFSYFTTMFGIVVFIGAVESLLFSAVLKRKIKPKTS
jgi:hypothetical protein